MTERLIKFKIVGDSSSLKKSADEGAASLDRAGAAADRSTKKYGDFANSVGNTAKKLAGSASAFGLPAQALRGLDDAAEVASMGLGNLSKTAAGFNAASVGVAGAGLAIGVAIGTMAREFEVVRNAADAAGEAIINAFSAQHVRSANEMAAATANWAIESKKAAEAFEKIQRRQMEGMTGEEKLKYLRREPELTPREKLIKEAEEQVAAEKKAEAEAKRAAEERERLAERAAAVWQAASEKARESWDKFYDEMKARGKAATDSMWDEISKRDSGPAEKAAAEAMALWKERDRLTEGMMVDPSEAAAYSADVAHEKLLDTIDAADELGHTVMDLGQFIGGMFGQLAQGAGMVVSSFAGIGGQIDKIKTAGGGLQGFLGKASGALGIAGIGMQAIGFVKGLFSGPSQEEKRAQRERAKELGLESAEIQRLSRDYDRFNKQLDALDKHLPVLEEMTEKLERMRFERTQAGIQGTAALFRNAGDDEGDPEKVQARMDRLGVFAAAMLQDLRDQGLSAAEAFREMGPAIDEAIAAAEKNGSQLTGALGMLADFQQKIGANEELATAAESIDEVVNALRGSGGLNQETAAMAMAEVADIYGELGEKGFTAEQATALMAEGLYALQKAAEEGTIVLDENTQALIDQAEARGQFEGLEDPMEAQLEVQKMMLEAIAALVQAFGHDLPESVQKYIDKLNDIPQVGGPPSAGGAGEGGGFQGKYTGDDVVGHAGGYFQDSMPVGPLPGGMTTMGVHHGEGVWVKPGGFTPEDFGAGGGGPVYVTVQNVWDGRVVDEHHMEGLRNNRGGLATETRRHAGSRLGM